MLKKLYRMPTSRSLIVALCLLLSARQSAAQSLQASLQQAFRRFQADEQMKYATTGFVVQDDAGNTVFAHQGQAGLAPASTQKIVTAAAALEKLGAGFRYNTTVSYSGTLSGGVLQGDLLVHGSGDPTLGSWRYPSQPDTAFFWQVWQALQARGITRIAGHLVGSNPRFSVRPVPGGWIYDDIGNYYGAGSWALNYHENQYDVSFDASGKFSRALPVLKTDPNPGIANFHSFVQLGAAGSGDNSVIYAPPYSSMAYATGSLGKTGKPFTISGAIPFGEAALLTALGQYLVDKGISIDGSARPAVYFAINNQPMPAASGTLASYQSVTLDSVIYWFLQKSINLYGEALAKTLAVQAGKEGDTEVASQLIRDFWESKGIDRNALKVLDGSGLSPQNRVTANALVQVLQFARNQPWFKAYYEGLPLIHNIKMKSGTIAGAKGYAGYLTDKQGRNYSFALLVNNYSGSANAVVQKMWQLLDVVTQYR